MQQIPGFRGKVVERCLADNADINGRTMTAVGCFKLVHEALLRASERACTGREVTPSELELLVPLRYAENNMTGSKLARELGMSRAGVAKHLKRLEERGLLQRSAISGNARSARVELTSLGCTVVDAAFQAEIGEHTALLEDLLRDDVIFASILRIADDLTARNRE